MTTRKFLAPADDSSFSFESDKADVDTEKGTTFVYNPTQNLPLKQQRQTLPSFKHRTEVLYLLDQYQTVVLCGETGSGKSTQIPQVRLLLYSLDYIVNALIFICFPQKGPFVEKHSHSSFKILSVVTDEFILLNPYKRL